MRPPHLAAALVLACAHAACLASVDPAPVGATAPDGATPDASADARPPLGDAGPEGSTTTDAAPSDAAPGDAAPSDAAPARYAARDVVFDMTAPADMEGHGIAGWSKNFHGGVNQAWPPSGADAFAHWGEIYRDVRNLNDTNTRLAVRGFRTFILSKSTGRWTERPDTDANLRSGLYLENYANDTHTPSNQRREPDGSWSAAPPHGYVWHFWRGNGVLLSDADKADFGGAYAEYEARLVVGDPARPDDRASAGYLAGNGADWFRRATGAWLGQCMYTRLKRIPTDGAWVPIGVTTVDHAAFLANPPPHLRTGG